MPALTFACPKCGRRMGVGPQLSGRAVRCPHCKEVVVAPASGATVATPPPAAAVSPGGASQPAGPSPSELPTFTPPSQERADSILAEHADDESLFDSVAAPRVVMPAEPASRPPAGVFMPDPADNRRPPPADEGEPPAYGGEPPTADPWSSLDAPLPAAVAAAAPPSAPPPPAAPAPAADPRAARRLKVALAAVAAYAVVATAVAVWGWLRGGDRGHPLLFIPDFFGQYQKAQRDKVSDLRPALREMGWDGVTIPPELRVKLGGRLAVGDLLVEPLAVEERALTRFTVFTTRGADPLAQPLRQKCLVLTLRLTNGSKDVVFHPTDPAYNRKDLSTAPPPLTEVVVNDRARFPGGPIVWPTGLEVRRSYVDGQAADDEPLRPGQTREVRVASADSKDLLDAVAAATRPVTWTVHLRRGLTRLRRQDVSVGALVAVEFYTDAVRRVE